MSEFRKTPGHECPPYPDKPAPQPDPNPKDCGCEELPCTQAPCLPPVPECPEEDHGCVCPQPPASSPECLETLINAQTKAIAATSHAEKLKKELEAVLDAARKAAVKYTKDVYEDLVGIWLEQDACIAELARRLACSVKCWRCILECHVCTLLDRLRVAEAKLFDDGRLYPDVHDLYDLQYWHTRDRAAKLRVFNRIDGILKAWQDPAATIAAVLSTNKTLHDTASKLIGTEPGKAIYDVFLKLIPLHLAIAPPAFSDTKTRIDIKYTIFCKCDYAKPVMCCSIDVGEWSLRRRLIGPQPYLVDPARYFDLICCLVEKRYLPAKKQLNDTDVVLAGLAAEIAGYEKQLADAFNAQGANNLEKTAKAAIPGVIDCCDYEDDHDHDDSGDDNTPQSYRKR